MESIVATTKVAAECLGWEDRVGTLQVGKLADIIVCKKNPLADIRVLEENANIGLVVKDGRVYKNTL
jgi:imidazolonepropionase-like amidohydrolase